MYDTTKLTIVKATDISLYYLYYLMFIKIIPYGFDS